MLAASYLNLEALLPASAVSMSIIITVAASIIFVVLPPVPVAASVSRRGTSTI